MRQWLWLSPLRLSDLRANLDVARQVLECIHHVIFVVTEDVKRVGMLDTSIARGGAASRLEGLVHELESLLIAQSKRHVELGLAEVAL